MRVVYEAVQAFAVLAPPAGGKRASSSSCDDQWLYEGIAGRDVASTTTAAASSTADSARASTTWRATPATSRTSST